MGAPMKKYQTVFPAFEEVAKHRSHLLSECNKLADKLKKYEDQHKMSNTLKIDQLRKEMKPVREEFTEMNAKLVREIPRFHNNRLDYLHPSFNALVNIQQWHLRETLKTIEKCPTADAEAAAAAAAQTQMSMGDLEHDVEGILQQIRTLCITSD